MGHLTVKRVPMGFSWPLKVLWKGYINPFPGPVECTVCDGTGYNQATKKLADEFHDNDGFGNRWSYVYGVDPEGKPATRPPWKVIGECRRWCDKITEDEISVLVKKWRLVEFTHVWTGKKWQRRKDRYIPTPSEINQWEQTGMGHDAINRFILIEVRAKRLGIWGKCPVCKGRGHLRFPKAERQKYENWKEYEPPKGKGFQLWETVSDGSPISPVFRSAKALARWCVVSGQRLGGQEISEKGWRDLILGKRDLVTESLLSLKPISAMGAKD